MSPCISGRGLDDADAAHLPYPSRRALVIRDNELERAIRDSQRRTVLAVGEQHDVVGETRIAFRHREEGAIAVGSLSQHVRRERRPAQRLAMRHVDEPQQIRTEDEGSSIGHDRNS
jgi:hypothetical protein